MSADPQLSSWCPPGSENLGHPPGDRDEEEPRIQRLLFESPLLLIGCLVILQLVLIRVWSGRRTPGSRWAMLIGFALFPLLLGLQAAVVTHRERVTAVVETLVEATQQGDVPGIAAHIADNFEAEKLDRREFLDGVRSVLTRYHVENARRRNLEITINGFEAEARFGVICRIVTAEEMIPNFASAWTVRFALIDDRWQATSVEPRPTPVFQYRHLGELMR